MYFMHLCYTWVQSSMLRRGLGTCLVSVDMNCRPSVIPITDINSGLYVITLSIHLVNL